MKVRIGILGATGAVGKEALQLLLERNVPFASIRLLASKRSSGQVVTIEDKDFTVEEATPDIFKELDFAIFSAGGDVSRQFAKETVKQGCVVIDNSSAFRMDEDVPLVIPEVNPKALSGHKGIIANPNCSTILTLLALFPLHKAFGLKRFFASTYQAVSGTGLAALRELETQVKQWAHGEMIVPSVYPHQIAFNVIPHVDAFLENGYTKEEMKMLVESQKILGMPDLQVSCTSVRVPVFRAHSIAISAEFEQAVSVQKAREVICNFPGIELYDEPEQNHYPMPIQFSQKEKCGVGRIRKDLVFGNGLSLWVSGDQLWKGAALNAIQILEQLL